MKNRKHKLITVSILISLTSIAIYIINRIIAASALVKNLLPVRQDSTYFDWRFGKIYYSKHGNGKPLLLIHDLSPAGSGYEWKSMIDSLATNHTVYCIDLLGCGRSDKPNITYTNFLYVQLINDFIKQVINQQTDVIATGLSSSFLITACNMEPERFDRIMLINPTDLAKLNQIPTKKRKLAKVLLELPLIGTLLYHTIISRNNIELAFTEKYLYNPFHMNTTDVSTYYEAAHRGNGHGKYLLSSIAGNYTCFNICHALHSINNSIYIIGGSDEPDIRETCALYAALNPSIEYEFISRTKHFPQLEAPQSLLKQIYIFFA